MDNFRLVKLYIPGIEPELNQHVFYADLPSFPKSIDVVECEVHQAFKIDPETDKPDEGQPWVIVYVSNMASAEIPAAYREAARQYIIEVGDNFSSLPLRAPEQDVAVCFKDERDGYRFFNR